MTKLGCTNCEGTGWVTYETQSDIKRIEPCHICNAGSWSEWADKLVEAGRKVRDEED